MKHTIALALATTCLAATSTHAQSTPLGADFQVNTYTTSTQHRPSLAVAADGSFVVAWESDGGNGPDIDDTSIQGQRFAADGNPVGGEFQINTYTTTQQSRPAVAGNAAGTFVVVWEGYGAHGTDTSQGAVRGQRFAADGSPLGGEFQINTYTPFRQRQPSVAMKANGDFVVAWMSAGSFGPDTFYAIHGQRFAADGTPIGSEFQINTWGTSQQQEPSIAFDQDGDFVVAWHSTGGAGGTDSDYFSVQGQRATASRPSSPTTSTPSRSRIRPGIASSIRSTTSPGSDPASAARPTASRFSSTMTRASRPTSSTSCSTAARDSSATTVPSSVSIPTRPTSPARSRSSPHGATTVSACCG